MRKLEGKAAVVTGAGAGIGMATAKHLAAEGAMVTVADINGDAAAEVVRSIVDSGGRALAFTVDVAEEKAVGAMMEATLSAFGRIDVLHNNAALTIGIHDHDLMLGDMDVDYWDRTMAVNLRGPMLCIKHALPAMVAQGGGSIINTSSVHGVQPNIRLPAYSASKSGIIALTKSVAIQYGKKGVRCNSLVLGFIVTARSRSIMAPAAIRAMEDHYLTPFVGDPKHVASVVAFLASDDSAFMTGSEVVVDGGITAHVADVGDIRRGMTWK